MEQLFYAPDIASVPALPDEESHHCSNVMRLAEGAPISVTDGKGVLYKCVLEKIHSRQCLVNIVERIPQKPLRNYRVHIAIAPVKNMDRTEWFVEKATEIGVDTITCLNCRYSERREIKLQRLNKIAINAMKQSQKTYLPRINEMTDFRNFISQDFPPCKMIAHCDETGRFFINEVYASGRDALILIGPEGDFSREEILAALSEGFRPVSLGESRLRTETAALVACHTVHLINKLMP
ncbi:MAG: 16S rRNA (uracil(1498)-N(3))-methyltransferase [Tannerella sp.]|jgi:16S rRNA (uracil1498-N3)-methyltransferase|nr:16S rRNA (uracil(1498)-N(3))-methyltransferase [Tannerella sp.]